MAVIDVLIPAFNERASLPRVLADLPRERLRRLVVVDNASTDGTGALAAATGAEVLREERPGYGSACLCGIHFLAEDPPDVLVFLDADYSDHPEELPRLVRPIADGEADLVIGSRILGERQRGALLPQARFGNWLACRLIHLLYGRRFTDLGPFRAIRWDALERLEMRDRDFGWTAEMQVKAARRGMRVVEVPVSYRRRIGRSKITGTVRGTVLAGYKIVWTILRYSTK